MVFPIKPTIMMDIRREKVMGEFLRLKGIDLNWKWPCGVEKAVSGCESCVHLYLEES